MATTTSNFSWPIPQSTDLVKDGATAIASLGSGIDTSMAELKGGTTGQVLSKASNTDMDFTWVAQDDSNAIQNAIVDAKGDLIAATAADTPARLAVGTDGQSLVADSTASTGLAYANKGMTLISTTTLSGSAAVSISSIPQTYKSLKLYIQGATGAVGAAGKVTLKVNGSSGGTFVTGQEATTNFEIVNTFFQPQANQQANNGDTMYVFDFDGYTFTYNEHSMRGNYFYVNSSGVNVGGMLGGMHFVSGAAITSFTIGFTNGNFAAGVAYLYGVA